MKTKSIIAIILCLLTASFVYNNSGTYSENTNAVKPPFVGVDDDFLIGSLHDGANTDFKYIRDTLGFNLWHLYLGSDIIRGKHYPKGWTDNDGLFSTSYMDQVQAVLYNVKNHNMKSLMQTPKVEYMCYGQRSDYQCEEVQTNNNYWFYAFNHHGTGMSDRDSGQGVIHCRTGIGSKQDSPGIVVSRLRANTEQSHSGTDDDAYRWDSECDWLIKPRIRIDSTIAHSNSGLPVCRIIVVNENRVTIKNTLIKAGNFLKNEGGKYFYNGQYLEEYYFGPNDSNLTIHGAWGNKWWYSARGTKTEKEELSDTNMNHADIQVYWYGNCDMWIDYVRVDNSISHRLLKPGGDKEFEQWLQWEGHYIACHGDSPYQFYIELFEFNQIPCISYVSRKLDDIYYACSGKHINVMADALCFYQSHMSWNERGIIDTPEKIKKMYLDSIRANQIFLGDPYPLTARRPKCTSNGTQVNSVIPETLPRTTGDSILANLVAAPSDYDSWLQGQLDTTCSFYKGGWDNRNHLAGVYLYLMKQGNEISKLCNIPFIAMVQAHQWIGGGEVDREPTNEELNLMTNLAISYGARGIIFWGFQSFNESDCKYNFGIMNHDITPRYKNVYEQPKWTYFKQIVSVLKVWGPTIMSFNNTDRHSYIYRLKNERRALLLDSYFGGIASYKPGRQFNNCIDGISVPDEQNLQYECQDSTYLQVATFKSSMNDSKQYFIIVNRRCSPHYEPGEDARYPDGENGGYRKIRILFDRSHPAINGYYKWNIYDVGTGMFVDEFNRLENKWVDLKWFEPGQGKLYEIVPNVN